MISVIVPIYNVEKYIVKCLESIVNQDYKDFELLLIDDGSTDDSVIITNEYLKNKDINWKLIKKENGGQSSSRNVGLKEAKGEYITFIDSDDYISMDFLSTLLELINEDNYDFSFCDFKFVKKQEAPIIEKQDNIVLSNNELAKLFLNRRINFVLPSMLIRKEFIIKNNLFFDERIRFSEDQMYIWTLVLNSKKSIYTYKTMYGYYLREKSIMTASPYNKIIKGYEIYKEFTDKLIIKYPKLIDVTKYILPRWNLGTLYSSAKLLTEEEYKTLYKIMNANNILNQIRGINDFKALLLAFITKLSPKLLYAACRGVKL